MDTLWSLKESSGHTFQHNFWEGMSSKLKLISFLLIDTQVFISAFNTVALLCCFFVLFSVLASLLIINAAIFLQAILWSPLCSPMWRTTCSLPKRSPSALSWWCPNSKMGKWLEKWSRWRCCSARMQFELLTCIPLPSRFTPQRCGRRAAESQRHGVRPGLGRVYPRHQQGHVCERAPGGWNRVC